MFKSSNGSTRLERAIDTALSFKSSTALCINEADLEHLGSSHPSASVF